MHPILISFGPVTVYTFGFFTAVAFLSATFIVWKMAKNRSWDEEMILDTVLITTVCGLIGARIFYIVLHPYEFEGNIMHMILFLKFPGLSYIGGLIGGTLGTLFWLKKKRVQWKLVADVVVIAVTIAHLIGSWGCFFNACMYGSITYLPWGVVVPGLLGRRHPIPLYFIIADILILVWLWRHLVAGRKSGIVTGWFVVFSMISIIIIEQWRGDSVYWIGFRAHQVLAAVIAIGSAVMLYSVSGRTLQGELYSLKRQVQALMRGEPPLKLSSLNLSSVFTRPWREMTVALRQRQMRSRWQRRKVTKGS